MLLIFNITRGLRNPCTGLGFFRVGHFTVEVGTQSHKIFTLLLAISINLKDP